MKKRKSELTELVDKKLFIAGITRKEAAEKANISYQYLNNILVSKSLPGIRVSNELAEIVKEKPEKLRRLMLKCYEERRKNADK